MSGEGSPFSAQPSSEDGSPFSAQPSTAEAVSSHVVRLIIRDPWAGRAVDMDVPADATPLHVAAQLGLQDQFGPLLMYGNVGDSHPCRVLTDEEELSTLGELAVCGYAFMGMPPLPGHAHGTLFKDRECFQLCYRPDLDDESMNEFLNAILWGKQLDKRRTSSGSRAVSVFEHDICERKTFTMDERTSSNTVDFVSRLRTRLSIRDEHAVQIMHGDSFIGRVAPQTGRVRDALCIGPDVHPMCFVSGKKSQGSASAHAGLPDLTDRLLPFHGGTTAAWLA